MTNTSRIIEPRHNCELPTPQEGEVRRCDICGRYWLGHQPPNPHYWRWTALGPIGRRLRGIR